jgi:hypothetical protein
LNEAKVRFILKKKKAATSICRDLLLIFTMAQYPMKRWRKDKALFLSMKYLKVGKMSRKNT